MSLRAFAKDRGVNHSAVNRAIRTGRLNASVGKNGGGEPVIADVALARAEWERNRGKPAPAPEKPLPGGRGLDDELADALLASLIYVLAATPGRRFVLDREEGRLSFDDKALVAWVCSELEGLEGL